MQNIFLNFLFTFLLFIGNLQAQSCSFQEHIKYPDGTIGCLGELPFAKEIVKEEKKSILEYIERSHINVIAISKNTHCKAIGVAASAIRNPTFAFDRVKQQLPKIALDRCMNQGCDCEIIIEDSVSKVDKRSLLLMLGNTDDQKVVENKLPTKEIIKPERKVKEESSAAKITDEQIVVLRRELEKEIRSSILRTGGA